VGVKKRVSHFSEPHLKQRACFAAVHHHNSLCCQEICNPRSSFERALVAGMTFRIISNTCGSVQQPLQLDASSSVHCNSSAQSVQLQQHQLSAGAGHHQCTRFCCFEPLFGNVFKCQTSGLTHICDQGCNERIFLDNHFDICR